MAALFADLPMPITNTAQARRRLQFTLADPGYEFPQYPVEGGATMESVCASKPSPAREIVTLGKIPKSWFLLERELALISRLGFADISSSWPTSSVNCRGNNIMVQGRGSRTQRRLFAVWHHGSLTR